MYKPLVASLIMGVGAFLLKDQSIIITVAISAVVYVGLIILTKALKVEEINAILQMIGVSSRKEGL
jgi:hypothetical protein